jgi:putative ABC transport system ATP-binding protein
MTPRLEAQNLHFSFGETHALKGVDVHLMPGEVLAVMGPSGSGKSTLLHCLAGILSPTKGEVFFDGKRIDNLKSAKRDQVRLRNFGFVFQFGDLIPELTLLENVALPMLVQGVSKKSAYARATDLMDSLEISDVANRTASAVSGGQSQRAAVARALSTKPAVIFADEPTGALDSVTGELVLEALISIARKDNASVVLVTHAIEVAAISDREIIIRDGLVVSNSRV